MKVDIKLRGTAYVTALGGEGSLRVVRRADGHSPILRRLGNTAGLECTAATALMRPLALLHIVNIASY